MKDPALDDLLKSMANVVPPTGDEIFRQAVWREVRHRRALIEEKPSGLLRDWSEALQSLFPRLALGGAALAVGMGLLVGTFTTKTIGNSRSSATVQALDLGVFQPEAAGMIHARLLAKQ